VVPGQRPGPGAGLKSFGGNSRSGLPRSRPSQPGKRPPAPTLGSPIRRSCTKLPTGNVHSLRGSTAPTGRRPPPFPLQPSRDAPHDTSPRAESWVHVADYRVSAHITRQRTPRRPRPNPRCRCSNSCPLCLCGPLVSLPVPPAFAESSVQPAGDCLLQVDEILFHG
jgi:hypothetical protein